MLATFSVDMLMDLFLLSAVQLALDRLCIRRLAASFIFLRMSTLPALAFPFVPGMIWMIGGCFAASAVLTGRRGLTKHIETALCMMCLSAACAGFAGISGLSSPWVMPAGLCGTVLLLIILRRRMHISFRWNIEVFVECDGIGARFPALIDTGNRLKEHRSGLPVLIAEASVLSDLAAHAMDPDSSKIRTLPYGVLGSSGEITCFYPDRILLRVGNRRWMRAPDCWIAVFPGCIPGKTRALAPPEFADAAQNTESIFTEIKNTLRRF